MSKVIAGGWMDYARQVTELLGRELTKDDCSKVMKKYLIGRPTKEAFEEIK